MILTDYISTIQVQIIMTIGTEMEHMKKEKIISEYITKFDDHLLSIQVQCKLQTC